MMSTKITLRHLTLCKGLSLILLIAYASTGVLADDLGRDIGLSVPKAIITVDRVDSTRKTVLLNGKWFQWAVEENRSALREKYWDAQMRGEVGERLGFSDLRLGMQIVVTVQAGQSTNDLPLIVEARRSQ